MSSRKWYPHGKESQTEIIADTWGTANVPTLMIRCNFESTPEDARRFAKRIEKSADWLDSQSKSNDAKEVK